jgi:hypothetical protein
VPLKSNHHLYNIRLVVQWKVERFLVVDLVVVNIFCLISGATLERIGILGSAVLGTIVAIVLIDREQK